MSVHATLKKLLSLSKLHLRLIHEEKWEKWEQVARSKEALYKELEDLAKNPFGESEKAIFSQISQLEKQTTALLKRKRKETKQEMVRIARIKGASRTYRKVNKESARNHFSLTC